MDEESFRLLGKRAKLDATPYTDLPLLINEDWGSDVLGRAYRNRLIGVDKVELFRHLRRHQVIIVTGPYRSGVAVASDMIADEFKCNVESPTLSNDSDQEDFVLPFDTFKEQVEASIKDGGRFVFSASGISARCHELPSDVAVVFMMRPLGDIFKSQMICKWTGESAVINSYPEEIRQSPSSPMIYKYWYGTQKNLITYPYETVYGGLRKHRLWLDRQERF